MTEAHFLESIDYLQSTIAERTQKLDNDNGQLKKPQVFTYATFKINANC